MHRHVRKSALPVDIQAPRAPPLCMLRPTALLHLQGSMWMTTITCGSRAWTRFSDFPCHSHPPFLSKQEAVFYNVVRAVDHGGNAAPASEATA